jgi:hypothetical protein
MKAANGRRDASEEGFAELEVHVVAVVFAELRIGVVRVDGLAPGQEMACAEGIRRGITG